MAGAHDGHRSRMRERFRREGLNGFADHEALELYRPFYADLPKRNCQIRWLTHCWSVLAASTGCWKPRRRNCAGWRAWANMPLRCFGCSPP